MAKKLSMLRPHLARHKWHYAGGLLTLLAGNAVTMAGPQVLRLGIDSLAGNPSILVLLSFGLLFVAVAAVAGIFRFFSRWLFTSSARSIEYELRNEYFSHLLRLPIKFFQEHKTGDLMSRATEDHVSVATFAGVGVQNIFNTIFTFAFGLSLMIALSPMLTLFALILFPLIVYLGRMNGQLVHPRFRRAKEQFALISSKVQESLAGIRIIRSYVREDSETEQFRQMNVEYMKRNMSSVKVWGIIFPLFGFLTALASVIVLWIGGREVISGNLTIGEFVAFNSYLALLSWPTMAIGWIINLYQRATVALERIGEIMRAPEEAQILPGKPAEVPQNFDIAFRDVTFSYPVSDDGGEKRAALANVDFTVPEGATVAVVGTVGSGKSTLASLIPRLFDIDSGSISIGGVDVRQIPLAKLRELIAFVPQDPFLFSDTVAHNLEVMGRNIEKEQLERAAAAAGILEEIEELSYGWDTVVGERGVTLSGGQKQRLSLARALLANSPILILDDPWSSVDSDTESEIIRHLRDDLSSQTCLLITHRLSAVKDADMIVVLHNGAVRETGRHDELIRRDGIYASLYECHIIEEGLSRNNNSDAYREPTE